MKLYGARPHDGERCGHGCCGGKLIHALRGRTTHGGERAARRAARKRARRLGKETAST